MQNGDEEVGSQGGYGRRNPDGVDFSEDDRRAEGKAPEKIREINGRRYAYGQPDAVDYTVPVRTAADYPALTKIFFCSPIPQYILSSFCTNHAAEFLKCALHINEKIYTKRP